MNANKTLLYGAMAAAFVLTASAEYAVAVSMGFGSWVSVAFPVAVDAYVLTALRMRREVGLAVTAMVGVNVLAHLVGAHLVPVNVATVSAVSAVAPLILWRVHKLMETDAVRHVDDVPAAPEMTYTSPAALDAPEDIDHQAEKLTQVSPETVTPPAEIEAPRVGVTLSDVELDAVAIMLRDETDPPRTMRQAETRFSELGYRGRARFRDAWRRTVTGIGAESR